MDTKNSLLAQPELVEKLIWKFVVILKSGEKGLIELEINKRRAIDGVTLPTQLDLAQGILSEAGEREIYLGQSCLMHGNK